MGGAPDMAGKEIAGRYRIQKKLGEGGMGAVYRGEQISLKRTVAVKLLRPELGSNQMILQRFNAEAHAVAKLSHPNTVNIYDFGQDADGSLFIAMEFIEGRSLREAIQKEGPFATGRALAIAQQVAASLSDAHAQGIVHRDLKPDNVMLQDRGKHKDVVRVLDFGIAKLRDDNRATQQAMTQAGDMLGTPQYMAPEQIRGEHIDGRTDIYALGCMIYEMVTGRMPYEAPTVMAMLSKHLLESPVPPTQRRPELALPPAIDHLVAAAMAKDPNGRPATMEQFSDMIAGLQAQLPADPNRSAPMAPMSAMAPAVTPPAMSAFQPPTPPPMGGAQYGAPAGYAPTPAPPSFAPPAPPYGAPGYQQVSPTAAIPRAKSKAPLFALLGVLAIGGGGAAVYFATKSDDKPKAAVTTPADPVKPPDPVKPDPDDEPDEPEDKGDPWGEKGEPGKDPWANGRKPPDVPTPPVAKTVGTDLTPLPPGASIVPPPGFTKVQDDENAIGYVNKKRNIAIAMAPLFPGTNDPDELARKWSADTGAEFIQKDTGFSAGANRDILLFSHTVDGVPVVQAVVLYITSRYRIGVIYQVPLAMATDEKLEKEIDQFFYNNVKLPGTLRE